MTIPESDFTFHELLAKTVEPVPSAMSPEIEKEVLQLFEEHRSRLLRYVLSIGLLVHDAEEVVQEVFLALFRHLHLGRPKDNLNGWLFRVAHNLALKKRLGISSRPDSMELNETLSAKQADPYPDPEEQVVALQRQERLLAVIRVLPEQDQYCLHLRAEGLRYREIAEVLGMSLGAVSQSLCRTIARLESADRR